MRERRPIVAGTSTVTIVVNFHNPVRKSQYDSHHISNDATYRHNHPMILHASEKGERVCFSSANNSLFDTDLNPRKNGAHGDGLNLLLVDGHSQFAKWNRLLPCSANVTRPYDYDNDPLNAVDLK